MPFWKKKKVEKKFRILSIDGGGIKGIFTAYAIWRLEEEYDIKILDYFDMVVGTSTGALISAGLLLGRSGEDIYNQYADKENRIFSLEKTLTNRARSIFFAGFEHSALENELISEFGNKKLSDLYNESGKKDFAFFSSNFTKAKPIIYTSPSLKSSEMVRQDASIVEALRTSTAAPFYFEPFKDDNGHLLLDGGLWANNPSLSAVALAASVYEFNINQIEVLSFGQTFTEDLNFELVKGKNLIKNPMKNQFIQLLMSVLTLSINSQTEMIKNLLDNSIYRYSPEIEQKGISVSEVNTKFLNYAKVYWKQNKESLVEFIKTGNNIKL